MDMINTRKVDMSTSRARMTYVDGGAARATSSFPTAHVNHGSTKRHGFVPTITWFGARRLLRGST